MMTIRAVWALSLALLVAAGAGCGRSPASRFYVLNAVASLGSAAPLQGSVAVGPVSIPGTVDCPQLVVQASPNQVTLGEFDRWAAPLGDEIARVVAGNLANIRGQPRVAAGSLSNFDRAYRVAIDVQRFDSAPGTAATLEAVWTVQQTAGGATRSGRTVADEPVTGDTIDALVAAHDRALATLSADIAAAIRAASVAGR